MGNEMKTIKEQEGDITLNGFVKLPYLDYIVDLTEIVSIRKSSDELIFRYKTGNWEGILVSDAVTQERIFQFLIRALGAYKATDEI